jgi:hypothetical protein
MEMPDHEVKRIFHQNFPCQLVRWANTSRKAVGLCIDSQAAQEPSKKPAKTSDPKTPHSFSAFTTKTMKTRILSTARLSLPLATAIAALLTSQSARALDGTWLGTTGNWTDAGTWLGGTIADGTGFTANFTDVDIAADQTITLAADRTIGKITFTDAVTSSNNLLITGANLLTEGDGRGEGRERRSHPVGGWTGV